MERKKNRFGNYIGYPQSATLMKWDDDSLSLRVIFEVTDFLPDKGEPQGLENVFEQSVMLSENKGQQTLDALNVCGWNEDWENPTFDKARQVVLWNAPPKGTSTSKYEKWYVSNSQKIKSQKAKNAITPDDIARLNTLRDQYWKPGMKTAADKPVAPVSKQTPIATTPVVAPKPDIELDAKEREMMLGKMTRIDFTKLPLDVREYIESNTGKGFMFSQLTTATNKRVSGLYKYLSKKELINDARYILSSDDAPNEDIPF